MKKKLPIPGKNNTNSINFELIFKILFFITVAYGCAIFWMAQHLPMVDLPQLSGQVAVLKDLLQGDPTWQDVFRINFFTPYLIPYALWLPLTFFFSIAVSGQILLTAGYLFFIWTCIYLRKIFNGDSRLDWLFVPCYFGICFKWGFITTLLAVPFGLLFVVFAKIYTDAPSILKGTLLTVAGYFLFFCHGFVFIFSLAIGFCFLLLRFRLSKRLMLMSAPYLGLVVLCLIFYALKSSGLPQVPSQDFLEWGWYRGRAEEFLVYTLGMKEDREFLPIVLLFLAFPFLLGSRLRRQRYDHLIPLGVLLAAWISWPSYGNVLGMDFAFIYHRFAIYIFPFYILLFQRPEKTVPDQSGLNVNVIREIAAPLLVVLACWAFFAVQSARVLQFAEESADFDRVVAKAEPKQLALYLVFDSSSPASNNGAAYRHFPAWYQAEHRGAVEFNFASYLNQVILYRFNESNKIPEFGSKPFTFKWNDNKGDRFYYIFIRHKNKFPSNIFADAGCPISKIIESGTWSLYRGCANGKI
jgi:hypothetical protein